MTTKTAEKSISILREDEDRSLLSEHIEKRGVPPEFLRLVNMRHPLPEDYMPELVPIENGHEIDRRCYAGLMNLLEDCRAAGGRPSVQSAYRSAEEQREFFELAVETRMNYLGIERPLAMGSAAWHTAPPGTSEHQLGLAVDIAGDDAEADDFTLRWLSQNAWRYGFIQRYPEGKEDITGIMYEPWHYRFVGEDAAEEILRLGLTLEEYLESFYGEQGITGTSLKNRYCSMKR